MSDSDDTPKRPGRLPTVPGRGGRTPAGGIPRTDQDSRDRLRSPTAGRSHSVPRENWKEQSTPIGTDPEIWRALRELGNSLETAIAVDVNDHRQLHGSIDAVREDMSEMRVAVANQIGTISGQLGIMTGMVKADLESMRKSHEIVLTAGVRVAETGAIAKIEDDADRQKALRKMKLKLVSIAGTVAAAIATAITSLAHGC